MAGVCTWWSHPGLSSRLAGTLDTSSANCWLFFKEASGIFLIPASSSWLKINSETFQDTTCWKMSPSTLMVGSNVAKLASVLSEHPYAKLNSCTPKTLSEVALPGQIIRTVVRPGANNRKSLEAYLRQHLFRFFCLYRTQLRDLFRPV